MAPCNDETDEPYYTNDVSYILFHKKECVHVGRVASQFFFSGDTGVCVWGVCPCDSQRVVFAEGFIRIFVNLVEYIGCGGNCGALRVGFGGNVLWRLSSLWCHGEVLGAKVLFVLGHTQCGAVNAAVRGSDVPGQISGLFQHIRPAVKAAKGNAEAAVEEHVRHQAVILAESSPVISRRIQRGELVIAGGIYDLASGRVSPVKLPI